MLAGVAVVAALVVGAVVVFGGDDGDGGSPEITALLDGYLPLELEGPDAEPEQRWSAEVSCGPDGDSSTDRQIDPDCAATADADRAYLRTPSGDDEDTATLTAYDGERGDEVWSVDVPADVGAPTVVEGVVLFSRYGVDGASTTAYDADTGEERWEVDAGASLLGADGAAIMSRPGEEPGSGSLAVVDLATGESRWDASEELVGHCQGLVVGSTAEELVARDFGSGDERWRVDLLGEGADGEADGSPTCFGEGILVQNGSQVRVIDTETGDERWSVELEGADDGLLVGDDIALLATDDEAVALNQADGSERWRRDQADYGSVTSTVSLGGGTALARTSDGSELRLVDLETGRDLAGPVPAGSFGVGLPPGVIYGFDARDRVVSYDLDALEPNWTLTPDGPTDALVVGGGRLYVIGAERFTAYG